MLLKYTKRIELRFRFLLICFCAFSFLYALVNSVISKQIPSINSDNTMTLTGMIILAILIGLFVHYELLDFFKEDWDWKPKNTIEKIQNEFFCIVGLGSLYYFSQVGAMFLFFPEFEQMDIYNMKLYSVLFAATSLIVYIIYRLTILKFDNDIKKPPN